ncbi:MAG: hypothetical protein HKN47_20800 [Pirellulaceae bacterium]|nr:hypothetical protein [Pirellulaceae bacterium]
MRHFPDAALLGQLVAIDQGRIAKFTSTSMGEKRSIGGKLSCRRKVVFVVLRRQPTDRMPPACILHVAWRLPMQSPPTLQVTDAFGELAAKPSYRCRAALEELKQSVGATRKQHLRWWRRR